MTVDAQELSVWIGRTETLTDAAAPAPIRGLAALLDREFDVEYGAAMPLLAHWLYFLPTVPQSQIGADGHPRRGGFLPPVPLPRRMWAGSRVQFHAHLSVGTKISRTSRIADVNVKSGRSGTLVFVKVMHEVRCGDTLAITEEQDIVYRDAPQPGAAAPTPTPAPEGAVWRREIKPDPVLLFRYSALTFNAHRIHFDRPYAIEVEHYPALVVHGPLIATLLLDLVRRSLPDARVARFSFRAVTPLFDTTPFLVCGAPEPNDAKSIRLWAQDERGSLATEAHAVLA